jgi:hypothetical protein
MYAWHLFLSNLSLINIERSFDIDLYAILTEIVSKKQDRKKKILKINDLVKYNSCCKSLENMFVRFLVT